MSSRSLRDPMPCVCHSLSSFPPQISLSGYTHNFSRDESDILQGNWECNWGHWESGQLLTLSETKEKKSFKSSRAVWLKEIRNLDFFFPHAGKVVNQFEWAPCPWEYWSNKKLSRCFQPLLYGSVFRANGWQPSLLLWLLSMHGTCSTYHCTTLSSIPTLLV